jgi:hypothetical protein
MAVGILKGRGFVSFKWSNEWAFEQFQHSPESKGSKGKDGQLLLFWASGQFSTHLTMAK